MKCVIIDDEKTARLTLAKLCDRVGGLEVVGEFENPIDVIAFLKKEQVDLIFLDIHMPEFSGFDFLDSMQTLPAIIITTTDQHFALQAFEYSVVDYLLKPIELQRFIKAIDKVQSSSDEVAEKDEESIFVNINSRLIKLDFRDILLIEAKGDYIQIKTTDKKHLVHTTLKRIEEKLPPSVFIKVHRSYIVNLDKIVDIEDNSILIEEEIIPISRANKEALMKRLNMI